MDITNPHKVLILFGSNSDKHVYDKIIAFLNKNNIPSTFKVASTHRTPEFVNKLLAEEEYCLVIAGAGLAAALPGSVASKTTKLCIGVPCKGNYEGLDALLSVIQLPPGIPVLGVGVDNSEAAAKIALKMISQLNYVNILGDTDNKAVKKCEDMLVKFDQEFKISDAFEPDAVNIKFLGLDEEVNDTSEMVIYVALSEDSTAQAALNLLRITKHGAWVGLNRGENAALVALQIINLDGRHDSKFANYRSELKNRVAEANK